jgi:hypothetical protein
MEPGFVVDRGHYSSPDEQQWVEGAPERSFWRGLKTSGRESFKVTSFRCDRCGYLESYANAPAKS